ncbi:MAG: DUF4250 domain-containing protein [Clostridiaceae bacterium]
MDNEKIKTMDPNILLSFVNTKLRDNYGSLIALCDDYDLQEEVIINRLEEIGYKYKDNRNQFSAE